MGLHVATFGRAAATCLGILWLPACTPAGPRPEKSEGQTTLVEPRAEAPEFWQEPCKKSPPGAPSYYTVRRLMLTGARVRLDTGLSTDPSCALFAARLVETGEATWSERRDQLVVTLLSVEAIAISTTAAKELAEAWPQAVAAWSAGQRWTADQDRQITLVQKQSRGESVLCSKASDSGVDASPCFASGPDADLVAFLGTPR